MSARREVEIDPKEIRYTQDSIAPYLTQKDTLISRFLANIIQDLLEGQMSRNDFPNIEVYEDPEDGLLWTLDNRRLYVFRESNIKRIVAIVVPYDESKVARKKTSTSNGKSIFVRTEYSAEKLAAMVVSITKTELCRRDEIPPVLHWATPEDRMLMWAIFVFAEMKSELVDAYHKLPQPNHRNTATTLVKHGTGVLASLLNDIMERTSQSHLSESTSRGRAKVRPGDIWLVRSEHGVEGLVILEGLEGERNDSDENESACTALEADFSSAPFQPMVSYRSSTAIPADDMITFVRIIGSITTYRRQLEALGYLSSNETLSSMLVKTSKTNQEVEDSLPIDGTSRTAFSAADSQSPWAWDPNCVRSWCNADSPQLNDNQLKAVRKAMTNQVCLIQGPPGTGKTFTTAVLLHTYLASLDSQACDDAKIVAAAPSNLAAILLAKKFVDPDLKAKRTPMCIILCDEEHLTKDGVSGDQSKFSYKRFTDVVKGFHNVSAIETLFRHQVYLVGPEDEAALKKSPPDTFMRTQPIITVRQEYWFNFVEKCFRLLERKARIYFTTCSGAANLHRESLDFSMVVIDESAKASEPDCLVAVALLKKITLATRLVLIGDENQLRPQLATKRFEDTHLACSLMERLHRKRYPHVMLTEQFRMHPQIRKVVSQLSYEGSLHDSQGVKGRETSFSTCGKRISSHVAFLDCPGRECGQASKTNVEEAELVIQLLPNMLQKLQIQLHAKVAVLSPYKAQVEQMRKLAREKVTDAEFKQLVFCTVDGSQGKEYDGVVISLVRTGNLGFVKDKRRFNVAISRAKHQLIVVGHRKCVARAHVVAEFLRLVDASEEGSSDECTDTSSSYLSSASTSPPSSRRDATFAARFVSANARKRLRDEKGVE